MSFALGNRDYSGHSPQFYWVKDDDTENVRCQVSIWTKPIPDSKNVNKETTSRRIKRMFSKKSKSKKRVKVKSSDSGNGSKDYSIEEEKRYNSSDPSPEYEYKSLGIDTHENYNLSDQTQEDEDLNKPLTKHWALVFEWDNRVAIYEADNVNGYLIPKWRRKYPKGKTWDSKIEIGTILLTPNQVNDAAQSNELNEQPCDLEHVNGQEWVKILAKRLDFELPLETLKDDVSSELGAGLLTRKKSRLLSEFLRENPDIEEYFKANPEAFHNKANSIASVISGAEGERDENVFKSLKNLLSQGLVNTALGIPYYG